MSFSRTILSSRRAGRSELVGSLVLRPARRPYSDSAQTGPKRACPSCNTPIPVTSTPCSCCKTLIPLPTGLSHHSILGMSQPVASSSSSTSSPFDLVAEMSNLPSHGYEVDPKEAQQQWRAKQREYHPDRYANPKDNQTAIDLSGRANDAYAILRDPLKRAEYILSIHSQDTQEHEQVTDPMLLAEIMEAREDIESAEDQEEVNKLREQNADRVKQTISAITAAFSKDPPDIPTAKQLSVELKYWQGLEDAAREWEHGKRHVMIH